MRVGNLRVTLLFRASAVIATNRVTDILGSMQRFAVILCALSSVVLANGIRGIGPGARAAVGSEPIYHAHTHHHEDEAHTHWHYHAEHEDYSRPDKDGDHHDEVGGHDHDDVPFYAPLTGVYNGRGSNGKILALCQASGVLNQIEPPALPPPKPPPRLSCAEDSLFRLRTVVLLT